MAEREELVTLRDMAKRLGFWDDAVHWQEEINRLDAEKKVDS